MANVIQNYPWERSWIKVESKESKSVNRGIGLVEGQPLSALAETPCLVLLGSVGMGKTTCLKAEVSRLKALPHSHAHRIVEIDMKTLPEAEIIRRIFSHSNVIEWLDGRCDLTLFLDSLDECWRRSDTVEHSLAVEFETRLAGKAGRLFLRISCRSAEWREESHETFERLFKNRNEAKPAVQTYVLAPLTEEHMRIAANVHQLDADGLIGAIEKRRAQALVTHPITAKMLISEFEHHGDFPNTRAALYEKALRDLCQDNNASRRTASPRKTTPGQRFAIARRIGAIAVLTNRYLINSNVENRTGDQGILDIVDLLGFAPEQASGERIQVDKESIAETLECGLFGDSVGRIQTWAHQSFAEFLAASYLTDKKLSPTRMIGLLTDTSENRQKIIPQLEETACWVSELNPAMFKPLLSSNPDVFLRSDSTAWSDTDRATLVGALFDGVRKNDASVRVIALNQQLSRLSHPKLSDQLRPLINSRTENILVRQLAIDMADANSVVSLAEDILNRFVDPAEEVRIRKHAGVALRLLPAGLRSRLKSQGPQIDWDPDEDDDLKGCFLHALWPSHLSIQEVLEMLAPPKKGNLFGTYRNFFEYILPSAIADSDIAEVAQWILKKNVGFDILGDFGYLPSKVFARSLDLLSRPEIGHVVIALIEANEARLGYALRGISKDGLAPATRLGFARLLVSSDLRDPRRLALHTDPRIFVPADIEVFGRDYLNCSDERLRSRWKSLIFGIFMNAWDRESLDALSDLARSDPSVAEELQRRTTIRFNDPNLEWTKQEHRNAIERKRQRDTMPSVEDRLKASLDQFDSGNLSAINGVIELLDSDPDGQRNSMNFSAHLAGEKAWERTPPELRARILKAIPEFLQKQSAGKFVRDDRVRFPFDIIYPLFALLFDADPTTLESLTDDLWRKWIPTLIYYFSRRNGRHHNAAARILTLANQKAPDVLLKEMKGFLGEKINDDTERQIIWCLDQAWTPAIQGVLLATLEHPALKPSAAADVLQMLANKIPSYTAGLLEKHFEKEGDNPLRAVAATLLLRNFPARWGVKIIERMQADSTLGKEIVYCLIKLHHGPSNWTDRLSAGTLVSFWEWLDREFPKDPFADDLKRKGAHDYTPAHDIYHFKNGILQIVQQRGTREAISAMESLIKRRPADFWLGEILAEMKKTVRRVVWTCAAPAKLVVGLVENRQVIRTAGDLAAVLMESLVRFQQKLKRTTPTTMLWNEDVQGTDKFFKPKNENNVSNELANFFRDDLGKYPIIANREVEIRASLVDPAQLCDIFVSAIPFGEDGTPSDPVQVVVEVKGAWNSGVPKDMEQQLFDRYMKNQDLNFGIFVVAHFGSDWNWFEPDQRRNSGKSRTSLGDLSKLLDSEAKRLSTEQKNISAFVIDARLDLH